MGVTRVAGCLATAITIAWLLVPPAHSSAAAAAQPNGKLLVTVVRDDEIAVARLRRNGRLDRSFGDRGFASTGIGETAGATGMIVGPSGVIDVAVQFKGMSRFAFAVVQLRKDGELDRNFGVDGLAQPFAGRGVSNLGGLAYSADGHLLVAAAAETEACGPFPATPEPCQFFQLVFGLDSDGQLDPSFGGDGVAEAEASFSTRMALAVAADGRIVAGALSLPGSTQADGLPYSYVSPFLADGSTDPTFGGGSDYVGLRTVVSGVAVSENGQIYAGGAAEGMFTATALHPDGTIDETFGSYGSFTKQIGQVTGGTGSLLREANGELLVAGPVASDCRPRHPALPDLSKCRLSAGLIHVDAAGNLDAGFGDGGVARIAISRSRVFDPAAAVQVLKSRDGVRVATPVFSGASATPTGAADQPNAVAIAGLRNDGSLDRRYGSYGLSLIRAEPR